MKEKIIFLVGPTAVGKSNIAVALAKKINAEIISCDSMQIYKGMDIITSKPPGVLRKKIPHHLINVLSPKQEYNVSRYRQNALSSVKAILGRGKVPLFVGGTGLYMTVLIDGIFEVRPPDKNIRLKFYQKAKKHGSAYLHQSLKKIDPEAAGKIHPHDTKRIIRALEVFASTGKPISQWQKQRTGLSPEYDVRIFCLNMEREKLYKRIEARVEKMFNQGLRAEVKRLLKSRLSKTAACAIGIKELKGYFAGLYDLEEAKHRIRRNSRLYAKRQLTWFRKDRRIKWLNISGREKPGAVAHKIWKKLS